ncbi:response regulator transcription factor [Actinomycetospora endophytica]|uniref:Response regulator transcription factor n=1 Tax=Actinomycetospora endophytica TaxID=2291215 RepID=A0ABS8PD83_9PSEU|nr:response regulator transcription factor [Actinomycetospora endophytica]MCD2195862.1 response regulator transcription factor [Actinomycetospora endophytica]
MPLSVLVVDDDGAFRHLITRVVNRWGHMVIGEAGSVAEALAQADELRPDTVLIDLGLPDGDGFSLARQLRTRPWPMRVVLFSSGGDRADAAAARRAGAIGFVRKDELAGRAMRRLVEIGSGEVNGDDDL